MGIESHNGAHSDDNAALNGSAPSAEDGEADGTSFERFERLTRKVLSVTKDEADKKRERAKRKPKAKRKPATAKPR
jgi:hypothetical protein